MQLDGNSESSALLLQGKILAMYRELVLVHRGIPPKQEMLEWDPFEFLEVTVPRGYGTTVLVNLLMEGAAILALMRLSSARIEGADPSLFRATQEALQSGKFDRWASVRRAVEASLRGDTEAFDTELPVIYQNLVVGRFAGLASESEDVLQPSSAYGKEGNG